MGSLRLFPVVPYTRLSVPLPSPSSRSPSFSLSLPLQLHQNMFQPIFQSLSIFCKICASQFDSFSCSLRTFTFVLTTTVRGSIRIR